MFWPPPPQQGWQKGTSPQLSCSSPQSGILTPNLCSWSWDATLRTAGGTIHLSGSILVFGGRRVRELPTGVKPPRCTQTVAPAQSRAQINSNSDICYQEFPVSKTYRFSFSLSAENPTSELTHSFVSWIAASSYQSSSFRNVLRQNTLPGPSRQKRQNACCSVASFLPPSQKHSPAAKWLLCMAWGSPDTCRVAASKLDALLQAFLMKLVFLSLLKILKLYDLICSPPTIRHLCFLVFYLSMTY